MADAPPAQPTVTLAPDDPSRDEAAVAALLRAQGVKVSTLYTWGNAPGDCYAPHTHPYHKVIYVLRGSITFGLPQLGRRLTLHTGDRLDLPAGVLHDATVGADGVLCCEAHLS